MILIFDTNEIFRPMLSQEDGAYILDMICSLLDPIGSYNQLQSSAARKDKTTLSEHAPDILPYLTIGFNKTTKALEDQARKFYESTGASSALATDTGNVGFNDSNPTTGDLDEVWAVLVCKPDMKSPLLWSHFPSLCAAASLANEKPLGQPSSENCEIPLIDKNKTVRLIQLPSGASSQIAKASNLDHLSVIGLRRGSLLTLELEKRIFDNQIGIVDPPGWMNQIKLNPTVISSLKTSAPIKHSKGQKKNTTAS